MRTWTSQPAGTYLVQGDATGVDVWSSIGLPFQPTGIARALRDDIQAALTGIAAVDGRILRATY
ncbi:MAG: hypothetical protein JWN20_1465, partial [Jatrophihabitantaceae bacterium]|nr:hypothetical protein [Jatrophihabitantaceae bacterium]